MNRINSAGWEYDAAGNQTRIQTASGGWQRLEYDAAGRLIRVRDEAGGVLASYTYGATAERLISEEGDVRTYYLWSGSRVITEYTEVGSSTEPVWTKQYVYLGARLLAVMQPSGGGSERVEFHHPDRLGTRLVTSSQDGSYYEQVALPFGVALEAESSGATNRRFTSYDRSSVTGLDYAVNRHYDPLQGRFTQVDPIGMKSVDLTDPQTLNLYAYVKNDPVNFTDPSGLLRVAVVVNCRTNWVWKEHVEGGGDWYDMGEVCELMVIEVGGGEIGGGGGGAPVPVQGQNNAPQQNDCQRFADIVDQMAKSLNVHLAGPDDLSGTVQRFMDQLAIRFTELPGASYFNAARALVGNTNERFNPREFGSEGFGRPYYEPPIGNTPSNQVRHAVGGLLAGYVRGRDAGLRFMNSREDPNDPLHGVPDINLNNQTVPMGAMIRGSVGYSYAAHLGNWIMETLCAHAR